METRNQRKGDSPFIFPTNRLVKMPVPNRNIRIRNRQWQELCPARGSVPKGTQVTVSGWLHTPSEWPTEGYKTGVALSGSIAVMSIQPAR